MYACWRALVPHLIADRSTMWFVQLVWKTVRWRCVTYLKVIMGRKKEINNESYHFYKVGIGGTATSFSFRTLCSSKILRTHSSASVIAKLARFLKVLLPEEKQISFSPILYFTQYSSEYYIYQLRRILI